MHFRMINAWRPSGFLTQPYKSAPKSLFFYYNHRYLESYHLLRSVFHLDLKLIKPTKALEKDFRAAISEFRENGETQIETLFSRSGYDMDNYLKLTQQAEAGFALPQGFVPYTTYWSVQDDQHVIGFCHFRHYLTNPLKIEGGHIGYSVRPSERQKGYGTQQLALMLEACRWMAFEKVMITCDFDNIASYKIIEANGGVLSGEAISPRTQKRVLHYWINL